MIWLLLPLLAWAGPPDGTEAFVAGLGAAQSGDPARATALFTEARAALQASVAADPGSVEAWHMLAQADWFLQAPRDAEEAWRHALAVDPTHSESLYGLAMVLGDRGDHAGAAELWGRLAAVRPESEVAAWNQGQSLQLAGDALGSRAVFARIAERKPSEWKALAKVAQLSQALGDLPARDAALDRLRALRSGGTIPELAAAPMFVRDQFESGDRHVLAIEYFDLLPDQPKVWVFVLQDPASGEELGRAVYGSSEADTQLARELHLVGPEGRSWFLDSEWPGGQANHGMWQERMTYDEVRPLAADLLARLPIAPLPPPDTPTEEPAPPPKKGRHRR